MKDKIFICYRRDDTTALAALLRERLVDTFGADRVFMDIDSIGPGIDFVDSINKALSSSALVLVLIGKRWNQERLKDPRDFVRIEIRTALEKKVRIIPLLFEDAKMPRPEELPAELAPLTRLHAVDIGTTRLNVEIRAFLEEIRRIFEPAPPGKPRPPQPDPPPRTAPPPPSIPKSPPGRRTALAGRPLWAGLLLVCLGVGATLMAPGIWREAKNDESDSSQPPDPVRDPGEDLPKAKVIGINFWGRAFSENYIRERGLPDLGFGLEVTNLFPGGPADRAGLRRGDVIRKAGGRLLRDQAALGRVIDELKIGDSLTLEIWRGDLPIDIVVAIENGFELFQRSCSAGVMEACFFLGSCYQSDAKDPARAASLYQQACEGDVAEACRSLGVLHENGTGVPKDLNAALALYQKSCSGGYGLGCLYAAINFENGRGVDKDPARAAALYERACSLKDLQGCYNWGRLHETGLGIPKDAARAAAIFEQACDAGNALSCNSFGNLSYHGTGISKDHSRSFKYFQAACSGGDYYNGCRNLGFLFEKGEGVEKDLERAASLYEQACEAQNGLACANLGMLYSDGQDKPVDDLKRSLELFQRGCDLKNFLTCANLGLKYSAGEVVEKDAAKAVALFRTACEGGVAMACGLLGGHHIRGEGTEEDASRGAALYKQACEGGHTTGCEILGLLHQEGIGVPKDLRKATELYRKACSGGNQDACARLEKRPAQ